MAKMYPTNIHDYNPTTSERYMYELLKEKLPDSYHVFYSVRWYFEENGVRINSECDFIIFNQQYGYLTLEVKGGSGITRNGDEWKLHLSAKEHRILKKSPFIQAEDSMRYFNEYYKEYYNQYYYGIFGYAVVFPFFIVDQDFGTDSPKLLIIDKIDMSSIDERIKQLFHYWKGKRKNYNNLTEDQRKKFINLINKRIALSAAAGSLIELKNAQFATINRVQDNYLHLISNFNKAFITGGAGTGKTWMAMKKSLSEAKDFKKVLLVCSSNHLKEFFKFHLRNSSITCKTFYDIVQETMPADYYKQIEINEDLHGVANIIINYELDLFDSIIIDEGQDFTEEWADVINLMLKDTKNSLLYVFYDNYQNVYNRQFNTKFQISTPPFILKENLRNTANIYKYAVETTKLGQEVLPNTIEGSDPELLKIKNKKTLRQKLDEILNSLIVKENVLSSSIVIISNADIEELLNGRVEIGQWVVIKKKQDIKENEIPFYKICDFKGLESDIIIFINDNNCTDEEMYVAYTRARFYLYEINLNIGNNKDETF